MTPSDSIQVLIKYDGIWDEHGTYKNYKATGMLLPCDSDYKGLCNTARKFMNSEYNNYDFKIFYIMDDDCPPIPISSDWNLAFYIDLKRSVSDAMKYALYIEKVEQIQTSYSPTRVWDLVPTTNTRIHDNTSSEVTSALNDLTYVNNMLQLTSDNAKDIINTMQEMEEGSDSGDEGLTASELQEINVGGTFESKRNAQIAICHYALTKRFNFKIDKSCKKCYFVSCDDIKCGWKFHASSIGKTKIFKVRRFNDVHTCSFRERFKENTHATSNFIANAVRTNFRKTTSYYGPINIQEDVKNKYGIEIDYHKAWRAKEKMSAEFYGRPSQSYSDLPSYLHMVKQANPGTIAKIKTLDDR